MEKLIQDGHDVSDLATKERIIKAATELFGIQGFYGASTREIAKLAGVNVASLNYHFKSKHNLLVEVIKNVILDFEEKIKKLAKDEGLTTETYALGIFGILTQEEPSCLHRFKLFLEATSFPDVFWEAEPFGYEEISKFLARDLNPGVPLDERVWLNSVLFTHVAHTAIMSTSAVCQTQKNSPVQLKSIQESIRKLVQTLIRDLNNRFPVE